MAWAAKAVLLLVFAGILLAIILRSLTNWLSRQTRLPSGWSLAMVLVVLAGLGAAGIWLLGPRLADETQQLAQSLPGAFRHWTASLQQYSWGQWIISQFPAPGQTTSSFHNVVSRVTGAFSGVLGASADVVIILFVGIYLSADPRLYRTGLLKLVPSESRCRADAVLQKMHEALQRWLLGKLALMTLVGVLTALGLWLLDMPLVFALALLAALFDFIPNVGPIISAVPAVLLALDQGLMHALYIVLLYLAIQTLESYILAPVVQQRAVSLPPALLISSQVLSGVLLGTLGLILPTPLTVVAMVAIRMLYVEGVLKRLETPGMSERAAPSASERDSYRRT